MIYDIANLRVMIENRCAFTTRFCEKWLSADQTSPADFSVRVTNEQFYAEKEASTKNGEVYSDGYIENICLYRAICLEMPKYNRFLMHAAVLAYEGEAYAFTGRSGIGKSTHTGLWLDKIDGSYILNGDKPILSVEADGKIYAHGTPWMGKEGRGTKGSVPLKAICFLEQSKENSIERLEKSETVSRIFSQLLLPTEEEAAMKTLELCDKLVNGVEAYLLRCNVTEEAVKTSFEKMSGKKYPVNE